MKENSVWVSTYLQTGTQETAFFIILFAHDMKCKQNSGICLTSVDNLFVYKCIYYIYLYIVLYYVNLNNSVCTFISEML